MSTTPTFIQLCFQKYVNVLCYLSPSIPVKYDRHWHLSTCNYWNMCKDTSPEYIIQEFSKFSASLSSIANVGLRTIQGYIDKYSLLFLGRLHSSDQNSLNNQIYRFISDVHVTEKKIATKSLLQTVKKYQLFDVFSKIVKKKKKD